MEKIPLAIGSIYLLSTSKSGFHIESIHKTLEGAQARAKSLHLKRQGVCEGWEPKSDHHGGQDCTNCSMMISDYPLSQ